MHPEPEKTLKSRFNVDQLKRLSEAIHRDVEADLYDGALSLWHVQGIIGLHEAVGFANRAGNRLLRKDDVFNSPIGFQGLHRRDNPVFNRAWRHWH